MVEPTRAAPVDAVILAGGTGERLGGVTKADLELAGRRLLDLVLDAVAPVRRIVVVAPGSVAVPAHVLRTLEDPPGGGPVAGIAAGLAALEDARREGAADAAGCEVGDVLVLACDMPGIGGVVPSLLRAGAERPDGADGVIALGAEGRRENLAFLARGAALSVALAEGGDRDRSARSLLAQLALVGCAVDASALADIDTWDQHAAWEARWTRGPGPKS